MSINYTARPRSWERIAEFAESQGDSCADGIMELLSRVKRLEQLANTTQCVLDISAMSIAEREQFAQSLREPGRIEWLEQSQQSQQQPESTTTERPHWSEGFCADGAAILRDGVMVPIEQVIARLNKAEEADDCIDALQKEVEITRNKLGACGAVAMIHSPKSIVAACDVRPEFWSTSLDNVAFVVDQLMETRAKLQALEQAAPSTPHAAIEALRDAVGALRYIEHGHGRLYGVGWDRVFDAAAPFLTDEPAPSPPAGQEELVSSVAAAMHPDQIGWWNPEARAVILVVADWLAKQGWSFAAAVLRREVGQ